MLCEYKDVLGQPGVGFHTHIGGVAWGDVIGTILIVWAIVYMTKWDFSLVASWAFFLAFLLHRAFCIQPVKK